MISAYIESGVKHLTERNIRPIFDGSYVNDETGQWHDTWLMPSATEEQVYALDRERKTGRLHCTCKAANDYGKMCKHRIVLSASLV